ncbi:Spermidine/putrescine import ATP-binding protein PotA [Aeromonas jandaei]|uniref:spermidine/putrescine ABC transporter ATP-binding protein PotA n=1 Tax=Aeromonas jandaei TaxID=650 RepID=UPI00366C4F1D
MMNNPQVIVALNKISKLYDGKAILSDLDLEIYDGEFLTLLGPSGCGKTTLLRLLAGLESVDGGTIHLAGDEITHIPAEHRHINTVFQSYALFPHMTVFENVAFGLEMQKVPASEIRPRVEETLAMVQLTELANRRPDQLSGGQQQRVAIARAVVNKPRLLLLDESLSALDYKLRKQMQSELKALQRRLGITFVFVTHDQEEALTMSDRILVMEGGKIIQRGTPRDIYESPANLFVARFIGEINVMDGKLISQRESGIWQAEVEGRECLLHTTLPFQPEEKVLVLLRPEDLRILDQDDDQSGALRGNIRERNYKGATLDSVIELESGKQLLISEFFDEDDPDFDYRLGQEVAIHWVDSWEVVLPYEPH